MSPLFTDVVQCLGTPLLEIKKSTLLAFPVVTILTHLIHIVVYLFLISYGRSKPEQIHLVIPNFLQVNILLCGSCHTERMAYLGL